MIKKLGAAAIITALVCTLGGTSVLARNSISPDEKTDRPKIPGSSEQTEVKRKPELKNNILKLVADAKAGKVAAAERSQFEPTRAGNWSKRTKIIVGVSAAVAVVVVILVVKHAKDHFFDDFRPFQ